MTLWEYINRQHIALLWHIVCFFHPLVHIPLEQPFTRHILMASRVSSQAVLASPATIVPGLCIILLGFFHGLPTPLTPHWCIPTLKSNPSAEDSRTWQSVSRHFGCQPPSPSSPLFFLLLLIVSQHKKLMKTMDRHGGNSVFSSFFLASSSLVWSTIGSAWMGSFVYRRWPNTHPCGSRTEDKAGDTRS